MWNIDLLACVAINMSTNPCIQHHIIKDSTQVLLFYLCSVYLEKDNTMLWEHWKTILTLYAFWQFLCFYSWCVKLIPVSFTKLCHLVCCLRLYVGHGIYSIDILVCSHYNLRNLHLRWTIETHNSWMQGYKNGLLGTQCHFKQINTTSSLISLWNSISRTHAFTWLGSYDHPLSMPLVSLKC